MNDLPSHTLSEVRRLFSAYDEIGTVYLFGSRARGDQGALSDYDFAILTKAGKPVSATLHSELVGKLMITLKTNDIDVTMLRATQAPELLYRIISEGKILLDDEGERIAFEVDTLNQYFDFRTSLRLHGLTKS